MESNLRGIVAGVACAVSLLSARELPVDVADVFVFEEGSGVDRQPAYAPLPGGGFVLVHPRYEQGDIDSSALRVAVSTDGNPASSEPLAIEGEVADAPSFVTDGDDTWLYFATSNRDLDDIALWRSRLEGNTFAAPERLADVPGLERLGNWPRWVDTGSDIFLTFRGAKSRPYWLRIEDGLPKSAPRSLGTLGVAYPRVVPMTGGGCFFSYQRPPDGGYMATWFSVSPDCVAWSPPVALSWPGAPNKPDVHDAYALPRRDEGVDVYYSFPSRKGPDARFEVGFVLYRRAVMPDGRMGPEEQLTSRDAFNPFAPTAHRLPDGAILVTFSDIHATGPVGVSAARMALFKLAKDAAPPKSR